MKPYAQLETEFIHWAENCNDVRAAILMGSRARNDGLADKWSDLDIIIYCLNASSYISNTSWLNNLGDVLVTHTFFFDYGKQHIVWALFKNGLNGDFVVIDAKELETATSNNDLKRGSKLLLDKDGLAVKAKLVPPAFSTPDYRIPRHETVENHINGVLWRLVRVAKLICRGDLFEALTDMSEVRAMLIKMMEWQTHLTNGWEVDVWYRGRYMHRWATQELIDAYKKTYAVCEEESVWQALFNAKDFVFGLSEEITKGFGLEFPKSTLGAISNMVDQIRSSSNA